MTVPRRRRWARRYWPVAPVLAAAGPAAGSALGSLVDASPVPIFVATVGPLLLAIAIVGWAIGGRRGAAAVVGLTALSAYWAWWFGTDFNGILAPLDPELAADGLFEATIYHVALFVILWPIVAGLAVVVAVVARRHGRPVWPSLGLLALALVVLALPREAYWSGGCNGGSGASPLIAKPFVTTLMDHGVGVLPSSSATRELCLSMPPDLTWKPFWLGPDGLPFR